MQTQTTQNLKPHWVFLNVIQAKESKIHHCKKHGHSYTETKDCPFCISSQINKGK